MDEVLAESGPFRDASTDPIGAYLATHDIDRAELNSLRTMRDLFELTHFRSQLRIAEKNLGAPWGLLRANRFAGINPVMDHPARHSTASQRAGEDRRWRSD
jgi:hypothetical protein